LSCVNREEADLEDGELEDEEELESGVQEDPPPISATLEGAQPNNNGQWST